MFNGELLFLFCRSLLLGFLLLLDWIEFFHQSISNGNGFLHQPFLLKKGLWQRCVKIEMEKCSLLCERNCRMRSFFSASESGFPIGLMTW